MQRAVAGAHAASKPHDHCSGDPACSSTSVPCCTLCSLHVCVAAHLHSAREGRQCMPSIGRSERLRLHPHATPPTPCNALPKQLAPHHTFHLPFNPPWTHSHQHPSLPCLERSASRATDPHPTVCTARRATERRHAWRLSRHARCRLPCSCVSDGCWKSASNTRFWTSSGVVPASSTRTSNTSRTWPSGVVVTAAVRTSSGRALRELMMSRRRPLRSRHLTCGTRSSCGACSLSRGAWSGDLWSTVDSVGMIGRTQGGRTSLACSWPHARHKTQAAGGLRKGMRQHMREHKGHA